MMIFIQNLEIKLIDNFALMAFKTYKFIFFFLLNRIEDFVNTFSADIMTAIDGE